MARDAPLSEITWWHETLSLTLETVSVLITQYNNTAVTRTTTIFEDFSAINTSTIAEGRSIALSVLGAGDIDYSPSSFGLNNGTNAFVDGSFTVAYPTPFMALQGFEFVTVTQQASECPQGLQRGYPVGGYGPQSSCACFMQVYDFARRGVGSAVTSLITLSSTYYQPLTDGGGFGGDEAGNFFTLNNVSFSSFIESALGSEEFNKYRSCAFLDRGTGPPALLIPAAALTATITSTTKSAGPYGSPTPKPGNPVESVVAPRTSTPAAPPLEPSVEPKPNQPPQPESSTAPYTPPQTVQPAGPPAPSVNEPASPQTPGGSLVNEPATTGPRSPAVSPSDNSGNGQTSDEGAQPVVKPPSDNGESKPDTPSESYAGGGSDATTAGPVLFAAPVISYAGSIITPDKSSYYNVPQVGPLSPGGPPITTDKVVYSLAPSATALISNGQKIPLPTFAVAASDNNKQDAVLALTFGGSTYTVDSSSHIVISGQTIVPGASAIVVSGTPISLAPGASVAVVGAATQSLYRAVPTAYPTITFAGATYTAKPNSPVIIQGQTLIPGSPAITISGTPVSLAPGASVIVVAGKTQSLIPASITAAPVITFAGSTYTANGASAFTIEGQTLTPGGELTISGTPISLAPGASVIVVAGKTQSLIPASITAAPVITFAGSTYTANGASAFTIEGQTLTPGGELTISGTPISLAPGASVVVIAGQTQSLIRASLTAEPVITFAGSTYTANAASGFTIKGQTLTPGGAIAISGTTISLATDGSSAIIAGQTQSLLPASLTARPVITFAGSTYTANAASAFAIEGQTLTPGGKITVSGTIISLATDDSSAVIADSTQSLQLAPVPTGLPTLVFHGSTYTANAASAFVIEGQTLTPGSQIIISGTPISLATDDSSAIIAGSTQSLKPAPITTGLPTLVFKGSTYTADSNSDFVIGGQTLTEGGVVTVAGTPISYASNGADVVVGTSTEAVNVGGLILSGFGNGGASSTGPVQFTGGAMRYKSELPWWLVWLLLGGVMLLR